MALQAIMIAILHFSELNYQADKSRYYNILETQNPESILQLTLLNYETNLTDFTMHTHTELCWEDSEEMVTLPDSFFREMTIICTYVYFKNLSHFKLLHIRQWEVS